MSLLLDAPLVGDQTPRLLNLPPASPDQALADDAIDLAAVAGLELDPWQQLVLRHALAVHPSRTFEDETGARKPAWAAGSVGVVVARQSGKGSIIEARELVGLFLATTEKVLLHTAHRFDTSRQAFQRIWSLIERTPVLRQEVAHVSTSHGDEHITTKAGATLHFKTRTGQGGRGFTVDLIILDEAMYLPSETVGALIPTAAARPNTQRWYLGSAVDELSHAHGREFSRVRQRAVDGDDSLCFAEWSAEAEHPDKVIALADPRRTARGDERLERAIAAANPGLGIRITRDYIEDERRALSPRAFAVERLSVGAWPSPDDDTSQPVTSEQWAALLDENSRRGPSVAFAVEVAPDRSHTRIAVGSRRVDGYLHAEVVDERDGTGWVVARIRELVARWDPGAVVIDGRSGAMSFEAELLEHDIEPEVTTARDMATATGELLDAIRNDRLRHLGQPELDAAVVAGRLRPLSEAVAWARTSTSTSLIAVTLAAWGAVHRAPAAPPPDPLAVPASEQRAPTADLMSVGF